MGPCVPASASCSSCKTEQGALFLPRMPTSLSGMPIAPPVSHQQLLDCTQETGKLSNMDRLTAGMGAGVSEAVLIVTPFEVVKTRLQQQRGNTNLKYKGEGVVYGWQVWESVQFV